MADDTIAAPTPAPAPAPSPAPLPAPVPAGADDVAPAPDPVAVRQQALQASIDQATKTSPDAAATTLGLAGRTGLDPALVQRNQPAVSALAAAQAVDVPTIAAHHPQLADWLSDPVNASVAHDDTDRLQRLDSIIAASIATSMGKDPTQPSLPPGFYMDKTGTIAEPSPDGSTARVYPDLGAVATEMELRGDRAMADELYLQDRANAIQKNLGASLGTGTAGTLASDAIMGAGSSLTAGFGKHDPAAALAVQQIQAANPKVPGWVNFAASGVGGLAGQLPGMALGAPVAGFARAVGAIARLKALVSPIAGARIAQFVGTQAEQAAGMTVASAQQAAGDYQDTGSASHALLTGLINEGVVGAIPASAVGHTLYSDGASLLSRATSQEGYTGAAKAILGSMGFQGAQGAAQALGQALNDHATMGKQLDVPGLMVSMVQNGLLGAGMGLAFSASEAMGRKAYQDATAAHASLELADHDAMAAAAVRSSPLNARAPAAMAEALHTMNQSGGQRYIPAAGWTAHWQAQGMDPVQVAEEHGVGDEYRQAMATGGDMAIPLDRHLQALAASPDQGKGLLAITRAAPDAMAPQDAAGFLGGGLQQAVEHRLEQLRTDVGETVTSPTPAMDAIHDDMLHQLMLAQPAMPTEMLEHQAATFSNVIGYLAKHTGQDAQALARRFPLSVTGDAGLIKGVSSLHDTVSKMLEQVQAGGLPQDGDPAHTAMSAALQNLTETAKGMGIDLQTQSLESIKDQLRTAMGGQPLPTLPARGTTLRQSFRDKTGREGHAKDPDYIAHVNEARQVLDAQHPVHPVAQAMHAYEAAFKVPHLHGGDTVHDELANADTLRKALGERTLEDELARTMEEEPSIPVIEAENVPYGMGMDVAGTKIFKDPDFKPLHQSIGGRDIDTITTTKMHEITETRWMRAGHTYEESHAVANAVEMAYLRHLGFTEEEVRHYETIIHPMIRQTRKWTGPVPEELNKAPYIEEHEAYLLRPPEERAPGEPEARPGTEEPDIGHLSEPAQDYLRSLTTADRTALRSAIDHFKAHPDPLGDNGNLRQLQLFRTARARRAQTLKQGARGALTFGDGKYQMDLSSADFSTFHHELMHYFTEVMGELHADPGADPQIKADYQAMLDFSGYGTHERKVAMMAEAQAILDGARAKGRDLTDTERARVDDLYAPHEKLAEAHEAYLMRGTAPREDLRSVFAKVRDWMIAAYKGLTDSGVQLSDAISQVFDRLHAGNEALTATEKELGEAQPLFASAEEAGMAPDAFQRYLAKRQATLLTRRERMAREALADLTAQQTERYQAAKAKAQEQGKQQVDARPDLAAIRVLQTGKGPHGEPLPEIAPDGMPWGTLKLDRDELRALYTQAEIDALPGPKSARNTGRRIDAKGGMSLERAAELFGFQTPDELVKALTNAPDRAEAHQAATDAILAQEFPSTLDDKAMREAALAAVHTEAQAKADEEDAKQLAKLAAAAVDKERAAGDQAQAQAAALKGSNTSERKRLAAARSTFGAPVDTAAIKSYAKRVIAKQTIRRLNPDQYRAAEAKAQKECHQALIAKDYHGAFEAKERQRLCSELFKAASDAKDETRKAVRYAVSLGRKSTQERIGKAGGWEWTVTRPDGSQEVYGKREAAVIAAMATPGARFEQTSGYLQQINALLERFELKSVSDQRLDRRSTLAAWLTQQAAAGAPVAVPQSIQKELTRTNWREASVQDIRDFRDALANIENMAAIKNTLLASKTKKDFAQAKAEQLASIRANGPAPRARLHGEDWKGSTWNTAADLFRAGMTVDEIMRRLDGHQDGGVMFDSWSRPIQEGMTAHQVMNAEDIALVNKALDDWGKLSTWKGARIDANLKLRSRTITPGGVPGGLTHWGRIMMAANWGNEGNRARLLNGHGITADQVRAELDQLDAKDRDLVHAMWSIVSHRRPQIGALEERVHGVQPQWVEATPFTTKAGDWRGGYFPIVYDHALNATQEEEATKAFLGGKGASYAMTSHGHVEARGPAGTKEPLLLDFSAFTNHLSKVNKDLALREVLMDRNKFMRDTEWTEAIGSRIGKGGLQQLQNQLNCLAGTDRSMPQSYDKALAYLRTGWNAATRAFDAAGAVVQLSSMPAVIPRAGFRNFARALRDAFDPRSDELMFRVAPMMRFRNQSRGKMLKETIQRTDVSAPLSGFQHLAYAFPEAVWRILDRHAWYAGFYKGLEETGGDQGKAGAMATAMVNATQGAMTPAEQSHWFRGGEVGKLLTNNMSYANAQYNLLTASALRYLDAGGMKNKAGALRMAGEMAMYLVVAPAFYLAAKQAANAGNGLQDWLDPEKAAGHLGSEAAYTLASGIPLIRDAAPALIDGRVESGLSGESGAHALFQALADFGKSTRGETGKRPGRNREALPAIAKDALTLGGIATHAPTIQVVRAIEGWHDAELHGRNPLVGALTGKQYPGGP